VLTQRRNFLGAWDDEGEGCIGWRKENFLGKRRNLLYFGELVIGMSLIVKNNGYFYSESDAEGKRISYETV
jgi:hypothetical protein